jgi:hypothetical protein
MKVSINALNYIEDKDGRCFYAESPKGLKYNTIVH